MYKLCKTEQSAKRQRQLEQGLLSMMASTQYEQISVSDLCDHMQVPRKSFYRYFASKDGALHALIDHTLMEYEGLNLVYRRGEKRTILLELTQFFQFWLNKKAFLDALQKSRMSGMLVERSMAHATAMNGVPPRFLPNDPPRSTTPGDFVLRQRFAQYGAVMASGWLCAIPGADGANCHPPSGSASFPQFGTYFIKSALLSVVLTMRRAHYL